MHFPSPRPGGLALSLAALGLAALAPTAARAQTQDLFVSTFTGGSNNNGTISRFAGTGPGTFSTTATTLSAPSLSGPTGLAFDAKGDLFAANGGTNSVTGFASTGAGTFGPGQTVATGLSGPEGLAVDAKGDLFAANVTGGNGRGSVTEFAPTGAGTFGPGVTFTAPGLSGPEGLAVDAKGDLFVADVNGGSGNGRGSITEFAVTGAGTLGPGVTFTDPSLDGPFGLAFDARGDLFAANSSTITEFVSTGVGTFGPGITFTDPILDFPAGLAFDAQGDLFTVNLGSDTIVEFASTGAGTFGTGKTVETGLSGPSFLTFGPSVPPAAVPEPSSVAAFACGGLGLLGLGIAARKKRRA